MATIKCRQYLPSGASFVFSLDANTQISKNFRLSELANNKAAEEIKMEFYPDFWEFIQMIQEFRTRLGRSMNVNSCYRTKTYNAKCGGSSNSLHLKGLALDWSVLHYTRAEGEAFRGLWQSICEKHGVIGGMNFYDNFIHLSYDEGRYFGAGHFVVRDYRTK